MPAQRSAGGRWPLRSRAPLPHCRPLAARPPPPLWLTPAHLAPRPVPRPAPPPARPIPACYFSTTQSRPSPPPPRCPLAPPMPWRPPCLIDPGEGRRLRPGRGRAHLAGLAGTRTLMRPPPPAELPGSTPPSAGRRRVKRLYASGASHGRHGYPSHEETAFAVAGPGPSSMLSRLRTARLQADLLLANSSAANGWPPPRSLAARRRTRSASAPTVRVGLPAPRLLQVCRRPCLPPMLPRQT